MMVDVIDDYDRGLDISNFENIYYSMVHSVYFWPDSMIAKKENKVRIYQYIVTYGKDENMRILVDLTICVADNEEVVRSFGIRDVLALKGIDNVAEIDLNKVEVHVRPF